MTSAPGAVSRLPVGSSANRIAGPADERPGDGDALALAAGELVGRWPEPVPEADALERRRAPAPAARASGHARVEQAVGHVVERGHARRSGRTAGRRSRSGARAAPRARRSSRSATSIAGQPRPRPRVGRSSVPMMCSSVDLPDPDGPTMASELARRRPRGPRRRAPARRPGTPSRRPRSEEAHRGTTTRVPWRDARARRPRRSRRRTRRASTRRRVLPPVRPARPRSRPRAARAAPSTGTASASFCASARRPTSTGAWSRFPTRRASSATR